MLERRKVPKAAFAENHRCVMDKNGREKAYDDPDVAHIWAFDVNPFARDMTQAIFDNMGWKVRFPGRTTRKTLNNAKQLCSGRECLSFHASCGAMYSDILDSRKDGELSIYYYLNADTPCQLGAWPDMWEVFSERLCVDNAIFMAYPGVENNFMGQGNTFAMMISSATVLGDIFAEAEMALRCLTEDDADALTLFKRECQSVVESFSHGRAAIKKALARWARNTSKIPLKHNPRDLPRVFITGSGEVELIHHPVVEFFVSQRVIPKVVDVSAFIFLLSAYLYVLHTIRRGKTSLRQQFSPVTFLHSLLAPGIPAKDIRVAMKSGISALALNSMRDQFNRIAMDSGLLNPGFVSIKQILIEGSRFASYNVMTETPQVVGNYASAIKYGGFDGLMHLLTFNCQPAVNAQAIIRPLSAQNDIPYAAIDMDGPFITANQIRTLETLSVQAKRHHREKGPM